jgi:hypothetical protein
MVTLTMTQGRMGDNEELTTGCRPVMLKETHTAVVPNEAPRGVTV